MTRFLQAAAERRRRRVGSATPPGPKSPYPSLPAWPSVSANIANPRPEVPDTLFATGSQGTIMRFQPRVPAPQRYDDRGSDRRDDQAGARCGGPRLPRRLRMVLQLLEKELRQPRRLNDQAVGGRSLPAHQPECAESIRLHLRLVVRAWLPAAVGVSGPAPACTPNVGRSGAKVVIQTVRPIGGAAAAVPWRPRGRPTRSLSETTQPRVGANQALQRGRAPVQRPNATAPQTPPDQRDPLASGHARSARP